MPVWTALDIKKREQMSRSNAKTFVASLKHRHFQYSTVPIAVRLLVLVVSFLAASTAAGKQDFQPSALTKR